jgi:hypothetical protein
LTPVPDARFTGFSSRTLVAQIFVCASSPEEAIRSFLCSLAGNAATRT